MPHRPSKSELRARDRLLSTWAQMKIAGEVALEENLKARLANPDARF